MTQMTQINQALGQSIIDGGLRRVEEDARVYGDAAAVVLSAAIRERAGNWLVRSGSRLARIGLALKK